MLKDIAYDTLKMDKQAYKIMLLRDQYGNSFTDIARQLKLSAKKTLEIYHRHKTKQINLYINHISVVLGYSDISQIRKVYQLTDEFYQDRAYTCAYLEKEYQDILEIYRNGEPGMPQQFICSMPPLRYELTEKEIRCIVALRETEKATFAEIAKKLGITVKKAKQVYHGYYHAQVLSLIHALQARAESSEEETAIWNYYFENNLSAKQRYELLTKK